MKAAFIHEYLNQYGGAERVLQVLSAMIPDAPIYTTLYDRERTGRVFDGKTIRTSFLQSLPFANRYHHLYSPLMPIAIEQFSTDAFDTVISVSASFAKGIITSPDTRHVCYCLTPPRFLWDDSQRFLERFRYPLLVRKLAPLGLSYMRMWDHQAAQRVDEWIAISEFVRRRIQKYYNKDAVVVHPPVNVAKFSVSHEVGKYWLVVGRLVAYKNFDLAIRVFNRLGWPLKIIGTGIEEERLRGMAKSNIEFIGSVTDAQLARYYQGAQAVLFPHEEDFGIVPLEAMASGRPVIAYHGGGALETVIDRITGIFFYEQTEEALLDAVDRSSRMKWLPTMCRGQAERFDIPLFKKKMEAVLGLTI